MANLLVIFPKEPLKLKVNTDYLRYFSPFTATEIVFKRCLSSSLCSRSAWFLLWFGVIWCDDGLGKRIRRRLLNNECSKKLKQMRLTDIDRMKVQDERENCYLSLGTFWPEKVFNFLTNFLWLIKCFSFQKNEIARCARTLKIPISNLFTISGALFYLNLREGGERGGQKAISSQTRGKKLKYDILL